LLITEVTIIRRYKIMANTDKEKGYSDGISGKENSNPHDRGVLSRSFDVVADVVSGNAGNITQTNDQHHSDYESGYKAGTENKSKSK
jgi:ribosome modulation factor